MIRTKIFWVIVIAVALGTAMTIVLWRHKRADRASDFQSVRVERGNMKVTVLTTGTVQPQNRLEIKSPIPGRIEQVLAREGDIVRKGQIIAWLSSTERAALLDAARAKGTTELAYWEELYKPTPLVAPIDGDIIARNIEPGQTVTAQDVLFVMSDRLIIEAQLDETDIGRIAIGQHADITLDAYPAETMTGKVDHIAYEAKTVNNVTMYMVDVLPERIPPFLRSGMTANVKVIMAETNGVLLLPSDVVLTDQGHAEVWLPNPADRAKPLSREVKTGLSDGKNVEIVGGLNEGDTVLRKAFLKSESNEKTATNPFMPARPQRTR